MNMKKVLLICIAMLASVLAGCERKGETGSGTTVQSENSKIHQESSLEDMQESVEPTRSEMLFLRLGISDGPDSAVFQRLNDAALQLEKGTGGSLILEIYPDGILGDEAALCDQLAQGMLDMAVVSKNALTDYEDDESVFIIDEWAEPDDASVIKAILINHGVMESLSEEEQNILTQAITDAEENNNGTP